MSTVYNALLPSSIVSGPILRSWALIRLIGPSISAKG